MGRNVETMTLSTLLSLSERDIVRLILEFLESRALHITQLSLERETGIINGSYSDDVLFLRQLILDGQWDNALDYVEPLSDVPEFDSRSFRYNITKYKFFELLCIKQEPGPMQDNDFTVEELVECMKELEHLCPSTEDFRRLCALLTLPKLSDHVDFKNWNPSSARVECFRKVEPLVADLIPYTRKPSDEDYSTNERLIQLISKGVFYEACLDYCRTQAVSDRSPSLEVHLGGLLAPHPKLSNTDVSFLSWLESVSYDQFCNPFPQKALDLKVDPIKKPKLVAQWTEQILATPIKPGGVFPQGFVPTTKLKCAENMSRSMFCSPMSTSMFAGRPSERKKFIQMSQSTTASLGFSIEDPGRPGKKSSMEQSQMIDEMFEKSDMTRSTVPVTSSHTDDLSRSCIEDHHPVLPQPSMCTSVNPSSMDHTDIGSFEFSSARQSFIRRQLEEMARRGQRQCSLPPVPEVASPDGLSESASSPVMMNSTSNVAVSPKSSAQSTHHIEDVMNRSQLFKEFSNRNLKNTGTAPHHHYHQQRRQQQQQQQQQQQLKQQKKQEQDQQEQEKQEQQQYDQEQEQQPHSVSVVSSNCRSLVAPRAASAGPSVPHAFHPSLLPVSSHMSSEMLCRSTESHIPTPIQPVRANDQRPKSTGRAQNHPLSPLPTSSISADSTSTSSGANVQFMPICQYQDPQAIRAVAFHPSGRYFALGTNSKQMLVCKYPDVRRIDLNQTPVTVEVLLARSKQHRGSVYCLGFNSTGELLATGSNDKSLRLMSFSTDACKIGAEMEFNFHDGTVRDLVFMDGASNRNTVLISGGAGNCQIYLTDCVTGQCFDSLRGHTAAILGLYSWCSECFVSCSQDKTVRFWDLRCSEAVRVVSTNTKAASAPVTSVCVDPGGRLLVSGHEDASIMLYDILGGRIVQIFRPHGDEVRTVRFSNAAYYLLSGSYDKRVVITDMRGDLTAPLMYLPVAEHNDKVIQCRWHPHDFSFLSTSADRTARLWSLPPPPGKH